MNTNDVEARLEALAAQSASPTLPTAILDRMAELEAGGTPVLVPVHVGGVHSPHRIHLSRGPRVRGLMVLGAAAALAIVSGLMYAGGSHPIQTSPAPTHSLQTLLGPVPTQTLATATLPTTRPVPVQTLPIGPARPEAAPPFSLGSWKQTYTFDGAWTFGHIWGGGPFSGVQLWWQNDEIVGLAVRYNDAQEQQTCVLQSKDGSNWTCSELPTPSGEACGPGPCPDVSGLAVHDGRWVAVGSTDNRSPSSGSGDQNSMTMLTWTSNDGINWKEEASARSTPTYGGLFGVVGAPVPPTLLTTGSGFVTSRCSPDQPGLWTSADGTSWQPATFAGGLGMMHCAILSAHSSAGYMATGYCPSGTDPNRLCVAYSADGLTWTTSDPTTVVSPDVASQLRIYQVPGPNYVNGRWIVVLDNSAAPNPTNLIYYEASSTDGVNWTMSAGPEANYLSTDPGLNEGDYHPAMFTELAQAGYWGVNNGPIGITASGSPSPGWTLTPAGSKTYWSPTGERWQTVSEAPPGWPVAVVETPTGLVAFMNTGTYPSPTTTVWVVAKR